MTAKKRLGAWALAALMAACAVLSSGMARDSSRGFFLPGPAQTEAEEGYEKYENDHVKFAMEVPEGYEVTEPYENVTLVTDGDDFRVSVEYAFASADNAHFIQSAADFAALIEADRTVLTDWVGSEDLRVQVSDWGDIDGTPCYMCAYDLDLNGKSYAGGLYIFDGLGDFGCYCMQALINRDAPRVEEYVEQQEHVVRSFYVTAPYQAEGYAYYDMELEGSPVTFFARDTAHIEEYSSSLGVYALEHVYSEASVTIMKTAWDAEDDLERVLSGTANYYFDSWDNARYTAQTSQFDLGRYSYSMTSMEAYDDGERYTIYIAVFLSGGEYWKVTARSTDEYAEQTAAAFSDTLFSLCINNDGLTASAPEATRTSGGGGNSGGGSGVSAVLDIIEAQEGFDGGSNGWMEPLGYVRDMGGCQLLVTMYAVTDDGVMRDVYSDAWLIGADSAVLLKRDELFEEVGGNSGSVAVAEKDGVVYVVQESHTADGSSFLTDYSYLPIDVAAGRFGESVNMMHVGTAGRPDLSSFFIAGEAVSGADFDAARAQYVLDPDMPINIMQGSGGSVMTFGGLRQVYG